jgi:hypothetical protein
MALDFRLLQTSKMTGLCSFGRRKRTLWRATERLGWMSLWVLVMLVSLSHVPIAGAQRDPASASIPTRIEVRGIVVNAVTGKPIPGAVVSTVRPDDWDMPPHYIRSSRSQPAQPPRKTPGPEEQQITDANGRFRFAAMKFGESKYFYVSRPGYLAPDLGGSPISHIVVSVMPGIGELRFTLSPEAEIRGKVTTSEGTSLQDVMVTLYRVQYTAGRSRWLYFDQQRTDTSGNYRFGKLSAGDYFVVSQWLLDNDPLPLETTNCNDGGFLPAGGYAPQAEPGVLDFQKATPIALTDGKHAVADLKLRHQVFYPVSISLDSQFNPGLGDIVDGNGRWLEIPVSPDANCRRSLQPHGDRKKRTISLPDGSYMFHRGGYVAVTVAGKPVTVTLPAGPQDAALPLQVRVHREDATLSSKDATKDVCSAKRPGFGMSIGPGMKMPLRFQVQLVSAESFGGPDIRVTETQKDSDIYELTGVLPGRYWVQTQGLDRGYVSAMTANGVNLMERPLEIGTDQTRPPLDITVRNDCGRIHFEKSWTKPPAGAVLADAVGIVDPFYELLVPQFMGTAPHGQFSEERTLMEMGRAASITLGNLAPGHYKVFETFDENAVAWFSPAELDKRLGPGKDVWLKAGEQVDLNIHDLPR